MSAPLLLVIDSAVWLATMECGQRLAARRGHRGGLSLAGGRFLLAGLVSCSWLALGLLPLAAQPCHGEDASGPALLAPPDLDAGPPQPVATAAAQESPAGSVPQPLAASSDDGALQAEAPLPEATADQPQATGEAASDQPLAAAAPLPAAPERPLAERPDGDAPAGLQPALESPYPRVVVDLEKRPEWVGLYDVNHGELHRIAVVAGPFVSRTEAREALRVEAKAALDKYINDYLGNPRAATLLGYDADYIERHLLRPDRMYDELVHVSFGPMHQTHALLELDDAFRAELRENWRQIVASTRLGATGLGAGLVLALLGVVFGYFRLDTATRGFYSRRLQIGAATVILAVLAAGFALAKWLPWI